MIVTQPETSWPAKPAGVTENEWYREIEKQVRLTVISADAAERCCPSCGFKSVIFQCQSYPNRAILALCKMCALARVSSPDQLWVRTEAALRQKWVRNGKDPAKAEQMRSQMALRLLPRANGGRSASGGKDDQ